MKTFPYLIHIIALFVSKSIFSSRRLETLQRFSFRVRQIQIFWQLLLQISSYSLFCCDICYGCTHDANQKYLHFLNIVLKFLKDLKFLKYISYYKHSYIKSNSIRFYIGIRFSVGMFVIASLICLKIVKYMKIKVANKLL